MLQLIIPDAPATEYWDEDKNEFVVQPASKGATIQLEHSLISVSKWESKWHKSFISTKEKTAEEFIDYIRCMTLTKDVKPEIYLNLTTDNLSEIDAYIKDPMTATTIKRKPGKGASNKIITSEQIYSWMISCEIPFSCEKWHLNRLLTLIEVCNANANPGKKMNPKSIMKNNTALNAARRSKMHSKG